MARPPHGHRRPPRPLKVFHGVFILLSILLFYHWATSDHIFSFGHSSHQGYSGQNNVSRVAIATLLLPPIGTSLDPIERDRYFTSVRLLNYQLQHSKKTRSPHIPFLVLVPPDIPQHQRNQLQSEGATIVPVQRVTIGSDWLQPMAERWKDVMIKLRLFELVQYDRILFLDADTFILKSMDKIFSDHTSFPSPTMSNKREMKDDEAPLPEEYLLATLPEVLHTTHPFPPHPWPRFNAGFFMMQPSPILFKYYLSLLNKEGKFKSDYPEQNLLNYAHREYGNMPWKHLDSKWNINLPNWNDVRAGVRSVHAKLWDEGNDLQRTEPRLMRMWESEVKDMLKFYEKMRTQK